MQAGIPCFFVSLIPHSLLINCKTILVSGMGVVWRGGSSVSSWVDACIAGDAGKGFTVGLSHLAGRDRVVAAKLDLAGCMAIFAAREAWQSASPSRFDPDRVGVIVGSSRGPVGSWEEATAAISAGARLRPTWAAAGSIASLSGAVATALNLGGPAMTVSATCASGAVAVATGAEWLQLGKVDAVLVGGVDSATAPFLARQMSAAGLVAPPDVGCRPFDKSRAGLVPGDAAGFLVLERSEGNLAARALGCLLGWSHRSAPSGKTGVESSGATLMATINEAIAMAGNPIVQYVNAHGTGTVKNDAMEAEVLRAVLPGVPVSSTKPVSGHCLGATPVLEAVLCLEAMRRRVLPMNANFVEFDEATRGLELLKESRKEGDVSAALSISNGFWGVHAALVFGQCDASVPPGTF